VIKGTRTGAPQPVQTLVVDLLPAGFEIETAAVSKGRSTTDYSWLPELTEATYTEERDDRFLAALDLKEGTRDFTLAYIVRAMTPGEFKYPALVAEDMYDPETSGRTAIGMLTVGRGNSQRPHAALDGGAHYTSILENSQAPSASRSAARPARTAKSAAIPNAKPPLSAPRRPSTP
jgi:Bacterial Alpha-2-macroglobulin MG10 domain